MTYYKFLDPGAKPVYGRGSWTPGRTRSVRGELVACHNGIHFCKPDHLSRWVNVELWRFEDLSPAETFEHEGSKMVTRRGRVTEHVGAWDERAALDFAFYAADRAVRVHAADALEAAGLADQAEILRKLAPVIDEETARAAWAVARAAEAPEAAAVATATAATWAVATAAATWAARDAAAGTARTDEYSVLSGWILTRIGDTP